MFKSEKDFFFPFCLKIKNIFQNFAFALLNKLKNVDIYTLLHVCKKDKIPTTAYCEIFTIFIMKKGLFSESSSI